MSTLAKNMAAVLGDHTGTAEQATLDRVTTAFGLSAAITILFNTLLAWVKDAYDPLNSFMAALTGHHWITHGLADIAVFLVVGWLLMNRDLRVAGYTVIFAVTGAVLVGGAGLAAWFFLV